MPSQEWIADAADALTDKLGLIAAIEVVEILQKVPGANKQTQTALAALYLALVGRVAI